jgi:integrase
MVKVELIKIKRDIKKEKVVIDWLEGLEENSELTYLSALAEFCKVIDKTPKELLEQSFNEIEERKAPWELQINEWFYEYEAYCVRIDRAKPTRDIRTSIAKNFFHFYKIPTPKINTRRRNKTNNLRVKNKRPALTKEDIKRALSSSRTLRLKAIILTQASSGLAISDVVKLKIKNFQEGLKDVGEGKQICQFHLRRQKTDKEFYTFISFEAVESIEEYLKTERKEYGSEDFIFSNAFRNKPVTEDLIQKDFRVLNKRLKNVPKEPGAYRAITSHMFRKFFNTQLTNSGMTYEIRKHMMGHVLPNKVDNSYYLENTDELLAAYLKNIGSLTINPTKTITLESKEFSEVQKQLKESKKEHELKDIEFKEMKRRMDALERLQLNDEFHKDLSSN